MVWYMIWVGGDVGKAKDHHPNQIRVEAVYQPYEFQGAELLIETKLNTEEGKLYQEVELPRRPYSDVEAEMANQLSILPNYEAYCRLIHSPGGGKRPCLLERHIMTEIIAEHQSDANIAAQIRQNSRELASPRDLVEREIMRRSFGKIVDYTAIASSEEINDHAE
jgi:hypothetical protein